MKRVSIVGQRFRGLDPYLPGIAAGSLAVLVREPNNPHDAFAVAVYVDGKHVGYLPKRDNVEIAKKIDAVGVSWVPPAGQSNFALDSGREVRPCVQATFVRSSNSAYPQVEIDL